MTFQFLRNFNKTLCASRLNKPNNIILNYCTPTTFLCTSKQPSIDYLNTTSALIKTKSKLSRHSSNTKYHKIVYCQILMLQSNISKYSTNCIKFVQQGGKLTAQGLANLYIYSHQLQLNDKWLQIYLQPQIPHHLRNMSSQNLSQLLCTLKVKNINPDLISLVDKQLKTKLNQPYTYVTRSVNEVGQFEQGQQVGSKNILLRCIQTNKSPIYYLVWKSLSSYYDKFYATIKKRQRGYALDE